MSRVNVTTARIKSVFIRSFSSYDGVNLADFQGRSIIYASRSEIKKPQAFRATERTSSRLEKGFDRSDRSRRPAGPNPSPPVLKLQADPNAVLRRWTGAARLLNRSRPVRLV